MAISGNHQGISVAILADGESLQEYSFDEAQKDDASHVTKYIEAVPDTRFEIEVKIPKDYKCAGGNALAYKIYVDGVTASCLISSKSSWKKEGSRSVVTGFECDTQNSLLIKPFRFVGLETCKFQSFPQY
jgi:hypothetical protein